MFKYEINLRKHEWEKHGTCALGMPEIRSESDYFNVTLGLRVLYDFGPVLERYSIVPDDTLLIDLGKIKNAIKSVLKVEPMIVCFVLKDSDIQYLSQMQVCMSKQFELVDCLFEPDKILDSNKAQEIQCQPDIPIIYPTIKHVK